MPQLKCEPQGRCVAAKLASLENGSSGHKAWSRQEKMNGLVRKPPFSGHQGHILLCSHVFKRFLQAKGCDQGEAEVTTLMIANKIIERNHPQCPKPGIIFLMDAS
ncbi:hypothetical protein SRHO_G00110500 [Serrasalmus rhombeus]